MGNALAPQRPDESHLVKIVATPRGLVLFWAARHTPHWYHHWPFRLWPSPNSKTLAQQAHLLRWNPCRRDHANSHPASPFQLERVNKVQLDPTDAGPRCLKR